MAVSEIIGLCVYLSRFVEEASMFAALIIHGGNIISINHITSNAIVTVTLHPIMSMNNKETRGVPWIG